MFKKMEIVGLSVYWNCGQEITKEIKSLIDLQVISSGKVIRPVYFILFYFFFGGGAQESLISHCQKSIFREFC